MELEAEAKKLFGHEGLRPGQKEVVEALLGGRSALAVLPTGGGKSLCYQLPALLSPGLTLVISPLVALMKDQVDGLRRRGIHEATEVHSYLGPGEAMRRLRDAVEGKYRLLYLSPERLGHGPTLELLKFAKVKRFVVDEAHCMSHWGHDFRPDYLALAERALTLGVESTLALTATATPRVREEIVRLLRLSQPFVLVHPFDRPNLFLAAHRCTQQKKAEAAVALLRDCGCAIVYVGRKKDTVEYAKAFRDAGVSAVAYHGGMEREERTRNQDAWVRGRARVVVGTIAFGMGIDKSDVRAVIHLQLPSSIEAYYQEIGRAGRDGLPAACHLLWSGNDSSLQHFFIQRRYPTEYEIQAVHGRLLRGEGQDPEMPPETWQAARAWLLEHGILSADGRVGPLPIPLDMAFLRKRRAADLARLEAMEGWADSRRCRRAGLLRYFGEGVSEDLDCGTCDICARDARPERKQSSIFGLHLGRRDRDEPIVRSALLTAVRDLGTRGLNVASLGRVLSGSKTPATAREQLQTTPHFASLKGLPPARREETVQALIEEGSLEKVPGPGCRLVPSAPDAAVPLVEALPILRLISQRPASLTRTGLMRALGGDGSEWAVRLEKLARRGYIDADAEAKLVLTGKGKEAVEKGGLRESAG